LGINPPQKIDQTLDVNHLVINHCHMASIWAVEMGTQRQSLGHSRHLLGIHGVVGGTNGESGNLNP
jgi:hypothetical protein